MCEGRQKRTMCEGEAEKGKNRQARANMFKISAIASFFGYQTTNRPKFQPLKESDREEAAEYSKKLDGSKRPMEETGKHSVG